MLILLHLYYLQQIMNLPLNHKMLSFWLSNFPLFHKPHHYYTLHMPGNNRIDVIGMREHVYCYQLLETNHIFSSGIILYFRNSPSRKSYTTCLAGFSFPSLPPYNSFPPIRYTSYPSRTISLCAFIIAA